MVDGEVFFLLSLIVLSTFLQSKVSQLVVDQTKLLDNTKKLRKHFSFVNFYYSSLITSRRNIV